MNLEGSRAYLKDSRGSSGKDFLGFFYGPKINQD
jgi:hypothetical protein